MVRWNDELVLYAESVARRREWYPEAAHHARTRDFEELIKRTDTVAWYLVSLGKNSEK
jgi:hypothetical protein